MKDRLPAGVRRVMLDAGGTMPAFAIDTDSCHALVSQQGAQLLSFRAAGRPPLLWLSERAVLSPGKAIRGGIPLCFPWFGSHPHDTSLPAHGFARTRNWQLRAAETAGEAVVLSFALQADAATLALWPHRFRAHLSLSLGAAANLTLTLANEDVAAFSCEFALHTYFAVGDVRAVDVLGLESRPWIDKVAGDGVLRDGADVALRCSAETDCVYPAAGGRYRLLDPARDWQTGIDATAVPSAIVWNPWQEKSRQMADMTAEGWRQMLCVECGAVGPDRLTLQPGRQREFRMVLWQGAGAPSP